MDGLVAAVLIVGPGRRLLDAKHKMSYAPYGPAVEEGVEIRSAWKATLSPTRYSSRRMVECMRVLVVTAVAMGFSSGWK